MTYLQHRDLHNPQELNSRFAKEIEEQKVVVVENMVVAVNILETNFAKKLKEQKVAVVVEAVLKVAEAG